MMKAVIVVCFAVLAIAHGATVPARLEVRQDQAPICGSCVWLVKTLKCEVADPDTQDDFIRILLKDFCPQLPAQAQDSCTQLVPALVPTAIMYLQSLSAKELCADATLCGPVPVTIRRPFTQQQQDFNYCPMCKTVVIGLKQELKNPENEKAVIERAHEVYYSFPSPSNHAMPKAEQHMHCCPAYAGVAFMSGCQRELQCTTARSIAGGKVEYADELTMHAGLQGPPHRLAGALRSLCGPAWCLSGADPELYVLPQPLMHASAGLTHRFGCACLQRCKPSHTSRRWIRLRSAPILAPACPASSLCRCRATSASPRCRPHSWPRPPRCASARMSSALPTTSVTPARSSSQRPPPSWATW